MCHLGLTQRRFGLGVVSFYVLPSISKLLDITSIALLVLLPPISSPGTPCCLWLAGVLSTGAILHFVCQHLFICLRCCADDFATFYASIYASYNARGICCSFLRCARMPCESGEHLDLVVLWLRSCVDHLASSPRLPELSTNSCIFTEQYGL